MKEIRIAPAFIALITSSEGACTPRTTSASLTRAWRSDMNATSLNAASIRLTASPAPDCMCSLAPSFVILPTTEAPTPPRRWCGCVSFKTATLTYMGSSLADPCRAAVILRGDVKSGDEAFNTPHPLGQSVTSDRRLGDQGANQLLVHELLDSHIAELASVAGVLDAAKRQLGIGPGNVVDEHHARIDTARHTLPASDVLGEDRAAQSEVGIVRKGDGLVLILDPEEQGHRAEEFISEGGVLRLDVRQDCRLHIGARPIDTLASHDELRPLGDRTIDLLQQVYQGRIRGQRTQRRLLIHRIPWFESRKGCLELLQEFVGEFFDDDEPLCRTAGLSGVVHPAPDGPLDGVIEVGIVENNKGVASAELHRGHFEVFPGSCRNASAGCDAAGQRHAFDTRIIDNPIRLIVRDQQVRI